MNLDNAFRIGLLVCPRRRRYSASHGVEVSIHILFDASYVTETHISRSSYQERSLNAYGEPLAARSWDDEGFVARDNYYTRSYEASELDARTSYDTYVDAGMQRREDAGLPVRELANLLYTRSARGRECPVVLCLMHYLTFR